MEITVHKIDLSVTAALGNRVAIANFRFKTFSGRVLRTLKLVLVVVLVLQSEGRQGG